MATTAAAEWLNSFFSGYDNVILTVCHWLATIPLIGSILTLLTKFITLIGEKGIIFFLIALFLMCFPKTRRLGVCIFGAVCCGALITNITLKDAIQRLRPFETLDKYDLWWQYVGAPFEDGYSFPSGHATATAAGMTAIAFSKGKKWAVPSVVVILAMMFSRNFLMAHYPSDVLAGAIVGTFSGFVAYIIAKFIFDFLYANRRRPLCELILNFDIENVLPFKLPITPDRLPNIRLVSRPSTRNKRDDDDEINVIVPDSEILSNIDRDMKIVGKSVSSAPAEDADSSARPSRSAGRHAAPVQESSRKRSSVPSISFKAPGAYKGKHERK